MKQPVHLGALKQAETPQVMPRALHETPPPLEGSGSSSRSRGVPSRGTTGGAGAARAPLTARITEALDVNVVWKRFPVGM